MRFTGSQAKGESPYLRFHVSSQPGIGDLKFLSFSHCEYQGFRGCSEYKKKRVLFGSERGLEIIGYDS